MFLFWFVVKTKLTRFILISKINMTYSTKNNKIRLNKKHNT